MRAEHPSRMSPRHPEVSVEIPDTWTMKPHANAVIAAFDPSTPVGARTTMYVTVGRIIGNVTPEEIVARGHAALQTKFPGATVETSRAGTAAGHPAQFVAMTITAPEFPVTLFQTETTVCVPTENPDVQYLVQVLCKCSGLAARELSPVFTSIVRSLVIK